MTGFRPATNGDLETLLAMQRVYYAEDGYPWDERLARIALVDLLADPRLGRVWLAESDGSAVGYVVLTFGYSLEYRGRDAFVDELFLLEAHRGRGLGRAALRLLEAACRDGGVRALHLEVERDKTGARALYRTAGFEDHERRLMTKLFDREVARAVTDSAERP